VPTIFINNLDRVPKSLQPEIQPEIDSGLRFEISRICEGQCRRRVNGLYFEGTFAVFPE
jgi:hypothetical protein